MDAAREITSHKVNGLNELLKIEAQGIPTPGGANHQYHITLQSRVMESFLLMTFQVGNLNSVDVNGISNEALLAIVIDRMEGFQKGPFACRENALALTKLQEAMHWLHHRTRERVARGVEGTLQK